MEEFMPPLMANSRVRIVQNHCVHITRKLLGSGEITAREGMEVAPYEILGKSVLKTGFSAVHLSKLLGVNPKDGFKYLKKPLNSTIYKGELLAQSKQLLFKKDVLSPTDGIIESYDSITGELRMRFLSRQVPLTAGVFGIVDDVDKRAGTVTLKTMATLVYGVIGYGIQRAGILNFISDSTSPVQASQVDSSMHQHIIVAGALIFRDALKRAAGVGVQGVISGGLNVSDYKSMVGSLVIDQEPDNDIGITVLATEGFGPIPIGDDVFERLKKFDGKFIFIDGNRRRAILPSSSEQVIEEVRKVSLPLDKNSPEPEVMLSELALGVRVRITWPPLMGAQGTVVGIDKTPTQLESGISTYLLTVATRHRKIKVPFPNVEIIV